MTIKYFDRQENVYTFYTLERGGAIISDPSEVKAKAKFDDAMRLARAVYRVLQMK